MIRPLSLLAAAPLVPLVVGDRFATDYTAATTLRTVVEIELEAEATEFELTVDGEPARGGRETGLGARSELSRRIVQVDELVDHEGGAPTRLRRTFEELHEREMHEGEGEGAAYEEERELPLDLRCPSAAPHQPDRPQQAEPLESHRPGP